MLGGSKRRYLYRGRCRAMARFDAGVLKALIDAGADVKERLMRAYFVQNRFIGSSEVLAEIAAEAGLEIAGFSEAALAALITRDCMIGTALPRLPQG